MDQEKNDIGIGMPEVKRIKFVIFKKKKNIIKI